jgi:hypothetical protein
LLIKGFLEVDFVQFFHKHLTRKTQEYLRLI